MQYTEMHLIYEIVPHYSDVIMGAVASQITFLTIVVSTIYSDADQRKHQSSASLAFAREIHRGPLNCPNKWPVMRKMFPFDWRHHVNSINHRGSAKAICKCGFVFRLRQDMYSLRRLITRSHKKSWWCEGSEGLKISYIFTICRMLLLWRLLNFR